VHKVSIEKLKSFRILIVEDEENIRNLMGLLFKDLNISYEIAINGLEALKIVQRDSIVDPFTLIITDINMPIMDGLTMIGKLQEKDIKIPTIIISALTENRYLTKAEALGVNYYLGKPFDFHKLLDVIGNINITDKKDENNG